ncbi:MAG: hypothetical protein GX963_11900 [Bacteroidales bacterium]|nr:hypothetical protein [Bacteroidales bacterium]
MKHGYKQADYNSTIHAFDSLPLAIPIIEYVGIPHAPLLKTILDRMSWFIHDRDTDT